MAKYQAFVSYARHDNADGAITLLRSALERFLAARLGQEAMVFQDTDGVRIGQVWEAEIRNALNCPCLIPIVTPAYLNSNECVKEFLDFADVESEKQQTDRILPLYYIEVGAIEQRLGRPARLLQNYGNNQLRVVDMILRRQIEDIRWFRTLAPGEAINTPESRAMLDKIAQQIVVRAADVVSTPTLVVAPDGTGFRSISAAIRRAEPGSRILVKGPFDYHESLMIDKPLEIVGGPGVRVIGTGGPAIACMAGPLRVSELGVTADGFNGVIISGGYCVLERCEVSGTRYSCVLVRNGAEATLLMCSLHHGEHCGVHAHDRSRVNVLSSRLTENGTGGLFYSQAAKGLVDGNTIEANALNGVYIAAGAKPLLRRNTIRSHRYAGVLVYLHSEWARYGPPLGIIEDNDISGGGEFGIQIEDGSNPCVRRNTISANERGGIRIWKGGRGIIYDNWIRDNGGSGIKNEHGSPWIGANTFVGNVGEPVEGALVTTSEAPPSCSD